MKTDVKKTKKTLAPILIGEEQGFAIFNTIQVGERVSFVLDRGGHDSKPVLFHPNEIYLTPSSKQEGVDYEYFGDPIQVEEYQQLEPDRSGFVQIG
jgi:hypothetical protein